MHPNETTETQHEGGSVEAEYEAISDRFRATERRIRRLRLHCRILTFGMLSAIALAGAAWIRPAAEHLGSGGSDTVEAQRIVLLGPNGIPRGEWSVDDDGNASLKLLDIEQRERLSFSVRGEGYPGLSLSNAEGERRVALGLLPDETTSLVFADGSGVPRAVMGLVRGDAANLLLADADGVSRIGFGLDGQGFGSVLLPDSMSGQEQEQDQD